MTTVRETRETELAGLPVLLGLMVRRDRFTITAWTIGMGIFALYVVAAIPMAYGENGALGESAGLFADPMSRLLIGPAYGFDDPTFAQFVTNGYGLYFLLLAALMSILSVSRHTRADEQTTRAELLRANVVGRHATLTAAMLLTVIANVAISLAILLITLLVGGYAFNGLALFAVGIGLTGVAFAGVTAITVQLSEYSRGASGLAGMVLGAAFVIRGGGDLAAVGGSTLSWFAPLAWAQQTAPFVLDRWWPLLLPLAFAIVTTMCGFWLSTKRDFGASHFQVKPGAASAPARWGTALGWAWRQQRALIFTWTAALVVGGLAFGAFSEALQDAELPEIFADLFTSDDLLMGYLAYMAKFMPYFVAAFTVMAVQTLRSEETTTRLESILAMPITRHHWLFAQLAVTAVAATAISLVVGWATGVGAAVVVDDWSLVPDIGWATLNYVPAVLVVLGLTTFLFGVMPRLIPLAWLLVGYAVFLGSFGDLLDVPSWVLGISPFAHPAEMPVERFEVMPCLILSLIAVVGIVCGVFGFRRRDVSGG